MIMIHSPFVCNIIILHKTSKGQKVRTMPAAWRSLFTLERRHSCFEFPSLYLFVNDHRSKLLFISLNLWYIMDILIRYEMLTIKTLECDRKLKCFQRTMKDFVLNYNIYACSLWNRDKKLMELDLHRYVCFM